MMKLSRRERLVVIIGGIVIALLMLSLFTTGGLGLFTRFPSYLNIWTAEASLKSNPKNYSAAVRAGVGYYNLKRYGKAEKYYLDATRIDEKLPQAWNNLGNTYREMLRYEDAEKSYQKAIELKPDTATSYINLSNLYTNWPETENADVYHGKVETLLVQALEPTKNDSRIIRALIDHYTKAGNEEAVKTYSELLAQERAK